MSPPFTVRDLGEIAIRVKNLDAMEAFYRDVIGLPYLAEREGGIVFFKLGDGYGGHTRVLALFEPDADRPELHPQSSTRPVTGAGSSLHHIALAVSQDDQEKAAEWFEENQIDHRFQEFTWIGWRGLFVKDPDGNTIELVAGGFPVQ